MEVAQCEGREPDDMCSNICKILDNEDQDAHIKGSRGRHSPLSRLFGSFTCALLLAVFVTFHCMEDHYMG